VAFTYLIAGDYERALAAGTPRDLSSVHAYLHLKRTADAALAPLRDRPEFGELQERAEAGRVSALAAFAAVGGPDILEG